MVCVPLLSAAQHATDNLAVAHDGKAGAAGARLPGLGRGGEAPDFVAGVQTGVDAAQGGQVVAEGELELGQRGALFQPGGVDGYGGLRAGGRGGFGEG